MKVVIFGGTTEGRQLAEYLIQLNKKQKMQTIEVHVCVASEYGAQVLPEDAALKVHVGRLEQADMAGIPAGSTGRPLCGCDTSVCGDRDTEYLSGV